MIFDGSVRSCAIVAPRRVRVNHSVFHLVSIPGSRENIPKISRRKQSKFTSKPLMLMRPRSAKPAESFEVWDIAEQATDAPSPMMDFGSLISQNVFACLAPDRAADAPFVFGPGKEFCLKLPILCGGSAQAFALSLQPCSAQRCLPYRRLTQSWWQCQ